MRLCRARGVYQARKDGAQIEAAIEQILHLSQISVGVAREAEGMIGSGEGCLQVAQHRVDGQERGVGDAGAAAAGDVGLVANARALNSSEAAQAV